MRVNDRGPFKKGRIVDLSKAAAKKLAMLERGTAKVLVEYADNPEPFPRQDTAGYLIQVGTFAQKKNADRLLQKLKKKGFQSVIAQNRGTLWNVQIGPLANIDEAEVMLALVRMISPKAFLINR